MTDKDKMHKTYKQLEELFVTGKISCKRALNGACENGDFDLLARIQKQEKKWRKLRSTYRECEER